MTPISAPSRTKGAKASLSLVVLVMMTPGLVLRPQRSKWASVQRDAIGAWRVWQQRLAASLPARLSILALRYTGEGSPARRRQEKGVGIVHLLKRRRNVKRYMAARKACGSEQGEGRRMGLFKHAYQASFKETAQSG
eukprot:TRINITY_DN660_c0_g2_i1.p2 TRINITY_DN660_c0_g2~~TRINITY_DN660_c0_g2_i1.p2  ORF type:complete len:137 (-),score=14.33 TRINITY_DN660_c0_g2_i1:81-491(-)